MCHVSRMEDDRPVKSLLYGESTEGTRPVGRPKLRYKDTCKSALKCGNALGHWKPGGALGPNMHGCVPLRCCDFHPVWEHFPQFKYPRLGAKLQKTTPCLGAKDQENAL